MRSAIRLLSRRDFRHLYLAVSISEIGDALHYIALMWVALMMGGPLGVVAVRLADSVPALLFGFHGGVVADRWDRKRMMVGADLARAIVLIPVAAAGLAGKLPLWGLVLAAFLLESATSYFAPAYGALIPALVDRDNVQEANGLIGATANALSIGGWAAAAGLLAILPISTFFAINSLSFFLSAAFISGIRRNGSAASAAAEPPRLREAFTAMRPMPALAAAVAVLGVAVTISAGTWIAGVPEMVRSVIHSGAGGFSIVMVGYAVGSIAAGAALARYPLANKARWSMLAWLCFLPGYLLFALGTSLEVAIVGALLAGAGNGAALILLNSAAQEQVPDELLGRVMGVISLVHRGAHAVGLILVSPLFVVFAPPAIFAASALAIPAFALVGLAIAVAAERRMSASASGEKLPARGQIPR